MNTSLSNNISGSRGLTFERLLADIFRRAGWTVVRQPSQRADFFVRRKSHAYAVELKSASEGRRDRLLPLLAQAILQAQAISKDFSKAASPLAVIAAPRIPDIVANELREFATKYGQGVSVGVIDSEGLRVFFGPGLEGLNAPRTRTGQQLSALAKKPSLHLFSDLNQWMLKVLLAPRIPYEFLSAPRGEYRNATELAKTAGVSLMTAFRFLEQLRLEGFLNESNLVLQLVRIEDLMQRWQSANLLPQRVLPMRWIIRNDDVRRIHSIVHSYAQRFLLDSTSTPSRRRVQPSLPRVCLALFAAADALGVGFVHGVPAHLYLEHAEPEGLRELGLSPVELGKQVDVYVRIPAARQSIFRGAVQRGGAPVCDILQVWLDVFAQPARGKEQADEIRRRVLGPLFKSSQP